MLDYLITIAGQLGHWGYLVIFIIVALECQVVLGLVMPGESLVLASGLLAEQGLLDPGVLLFVISSAAIVGDSIGYELGWHLGRGWLLKHGSRVGLRQEHLDRVDGFFARHSGKAVFSSHFLHLLRALMPFVAGARRMHYLKFLLFNAVGCIVWATVFVSLGYLAGESWHVAAKWIGDAGEIIGGFLLLAIAVGWLWRRLGRHEAYVKRRWQAVAEHPRVVVLRRRFAPQLEFLIERLSPHGYLGLHLTIGVLLLIGATRLFGGIAQDVVAGDPLTVIDKNVAEWFHEHQTPGVTTTMQLVTDLASATWVTGVTMVAALVLWWRRYWFRLLALVLVLPGGMVLDILLKIAYHRHRPIFAESFLIFHGYSFPSGHTMAATLLYGVLAAFAAIALDAWRWQVGVFLGAFVMVLLVGFSRVYLGAHYLSDVLGAAAAGLAWLALSLTAVDTFRRSRLRLRNRSVRNPVDRGESDFSNTLSAGDNSEYKRNSNNERSTTMLNKAETLKGYSLQNIDAETIGKVKEFYFDDRHWTIRYLVADTGNWLTGRQVLISPYALVAVNSDHENIVLDLTKKQIEDSPSLNSDKPVSRQFEEVYNVYYGWPMYWGGPYMWGAYPYIVRDREQWREANQGEKTWDPHLRSTHDVRGYNIQAVDSEIGHVEDFIIDDETWAIRYLIIDTQNWWPGKKVLVAPQWIERVSWSESKVFINLSREAIKQSPEYSEESLLTQDYETGLHRHYNRQGYWVDGPADKEHSR